MSATTRKRLERVFFAALIIAWCYSCLQIYAAS